MSYCHGAVFRDRECDENPDIFVCRIVLVQCFVTANVTRTRMFLYVVLLFVIMVQCFVTANVTKTRMFLYVVLFWSSVS